MNNGAKTMNTMHLATIYIYSDIGNTPITKRGGSYRDDVLKIEVPVRDPNDARETCERLIRETEHGKGGHFSVPTWWNQNTRSAFVGSGWPSMPPKWKLI